ncbi:MAG: beta-lactamase family protein [Deltaproteobacteria bacterium]|nr:beta-lactamase family protein [Deltaproteobacteria bacterium]
MLDDVLLETIGAEVDAGALPPDAGIAVALVRGGRTERWTFGLRERDRGLPVTQATMFDLCSLTKSFTAAGLVKAADEGRLDLDRPINAAKRLLSFPNERLNDDVTVADLLSHRTGITAGDLLWYFGQVKRGALLAAVEQLPTIDGAFRRAFLYNNILYGVLGELYPALTGETWESWITTGLLEPLGMTATTFAPGVELDVALPYVVTRRVQSADASAVAAAGAMRSTLDDSARWLAFWTNGGRAADGTSVLSERSIARMFDRAVAFGGASPMLLSGLEWAASDLHYGLGWFVGTYEGRRLTFVPGFVDGFSNVMAVLPDERIGVVVLSNVNYCGAVGRLSRAVLDAVTKTMTAGPEPDPRSVFAGEYRNQTYGNVTVAKRGSRWHLQYGGRAWPLTWNDGGAAQAVATVFGLEIPLPLVCRLTEGRPEIDIPLSLDPRLQSQTFTKT